MNNRTFRTLAPPGLSARFAVVVTFAGALFAACDIHSPTKPGALASITVTPSVTLAINATQQFTAVGQDAAGTVVEISPTWSIVAGGGAVGPTGLFTAGTTPGVFTATVKAVHDGISGTASVTVIVGSLAAITVTPNPVTLAINGTQQFTAEGTDAGGNVVAISPAWSVVAGGGAITSVALFTAGTVPGTFPNTVRATSGSISGSATVAVTTGILATITVTPNPVTLPISGTQQFTAVGRDASGNIITISPAWSVTTGGGTITGAALFTAGTVPGTFPNTVRATSGSIVGTATVEVTTGALATITVTPNPETLISAATQQFTAVGKDAGGNVVGMSPIWSVVAGGGVIDNAGVFTSGAVAGTFVNTVRANSGSISGFATVVVTEPPPPIVDLGTAATHGILGATTVTCVALTTVSADVGVAPGTAITGFPPCAGTLHAGDAYAQSAHDNLPTAFNQLDAMPCDAILSSLGGQTLQPGVYCAPAAQTLTGELFLDALGNPNASFVIRAGTTLTATAAQITLLNGAQAKNIYWLVGSSATLGAGSAMKGSMIVFTSITIGDNVTILGRALALNGAVTLGSGITVTLP